jgi:alkaline phosphatase D
MDRRQFLKFSGFITASAATSGLAGCGSGSGDYVEPGIPAAKGRDWKFPQSVASGDPRADSILLWTRVVPAAMDAVATVPAGSFDTGIYLQVTADANTPGGNGALAGALVANLKLAAQAQYDNTIRHKLSGLQPNTTYYYQFIAGDIRSNIGRFKTAPAAASTVPQLRFAYLTCQDWSINHWGALSHIAANEELDFIVHLGDYIYETVGETFQAGAIRVCRRCTSALP